MHLISPARSKPFGSERSHFAHSPHLLAALILLIPPEIGRELKRKAKSRACLPGFCCARGPRGPSPKQPWALASQGSVRGKRAPGDGGGDLGGFIYFIIY